MGSSASTRAATAVAGATGEDTAWAVAGGDDDVATSEAWVFEDIALKHLSTDAAPSRVVVRIEPELLGFIVEERSTWRPRRTWRTRKSYATTRADAVVEAGRIAHSWLSRGYGLSKS